MLNIRRLLLMALVGAIIPIAACGSPTANQSAGPVTSAPTASASATAPTPRPNFRAIMAKAPYAYTGMCQVEQHKGRWIQRGSDITDRPAPVPCANLEAEIGQTDTTASPPNHRYAETEGWDGNQNTPTDKIWIKASQQPNGDWLVTWGVKPGTRVEWLFAFAGPMVSGSAGRYLWHSRGMVSYPAFSAYANDLDAPTGRYTTIMGPPAPKP